MKILCTSDWHGDATTAGVSREDDVALAVGEVIATAAKEAVDLVLFLGDLCDPDSGRTHRAAALGVLAAAELWVKHRIPSRWLVGNHDVVEDGAGTHTLAGIAALEHAYRRREIDYRPIRVFEAPAVEQGFGATLVVLPFTPRSRPYDPAAFIRQAALELDRKAPRDPNHPTVIIAGHLNLEGIEPGSETQDMPRGRDVSFPLVACKEHFPGALLVNGHYHTRQVFNGVVIPGSLERLTFGEERNTPGYLLLEV